VAGLYKPEMMIEISADGQHKKHTVIADNFRVDLLRLLEPPLLAAASKSGKGVEARNRFRDVLDQMTEGPIAQLEHQVANILRRLCL
jgi:hypothetical protein